MIGVILGLIVLGIGIVPVAFLATLVHGQWYSAADLVILCAATFGARLLAFWLCQKAEQDSIAEVDPQRARPRTQRHSWTISLGILGTVGLLIFVCGWVSSPKVKLSAAEVFSQTSGSVVRIEVHCRDGTEMVGSGFVTLLENHPCILTNRHVVEKANQVKVGLREGLLFDAPDYKVAENIDLAVIEIPLQLHLRPLPLRKTTIRVGEIAYAVGFPLGLAKSITEGLVTATYLDALQFDAPISSGNSGSPVLDADAQVIGIATLASKGTGDAVAQNLNMAVPATEFPLLEKFGPVPPPTESQQEPTSPPFAEPKNGGEQEPNISPGPEVRPALPPDSDPQTSTPNWPDGRVLGHPEQRTRTFIINVQRADKLKLRSGPGTKFLALTEIPFNGKDILAFDQDRMWDGDTWWVPVEWHGFRGYVGQRYLATRN